MARIGYVTRAQREYLKHEISRRQLERYVREGKPCGGCSLPRKFYRGAGCDACRMRSRRQS